MTYDNPWIYNSKIFETEDIQDNYGFVYKITNLITGKMYLGRKYFWSKRKIKKAKRRTTLESDWKNYYGSSDVLLADIELLGKDSFKREIISTHKTKGQVNYTEIKLQFAYDVIHALDSNGKHLYYNTNIMGRYFTPKNSNYEKTEEHKKKLSESLKSKGIKPKTCTEPKSEETKEKLRQASLKNSLFVTDNPRTRENIDYTILKEDGTIETIANLQNILGLTDRQFSVLREWSKKQPLLEYKGKVKKTDIHKKYKVRILKFYENRYDKTTIYDDTIDIPLEI